MRQENKDHAQFFSYLCHLSGDPLLVGETMKKNPNSDEPNHFILNKLDVLRNRDKKRETLRRQGREE